MKQTSLQTPVKIRYRPHPKIPKILWPVVDVLFTHNDISLPHGSFGLVDSESSISVLHPFIAEALGFDFKKLGRPESTGTSASGSYKSWILPDAIIVTIYGYSFRFQFTVIDNRNLMWPCILGGDSIFQVARLDFQKYKGFFEIRFRSDIH